MKQITTLNEVDEAISKEGLQVLKFYGTWCQPCKMLSRTIEDIEPTLEGVTFYEVDVDEAEAELLDKYGIQSVPAMIFFNEGLQVGREIGNIPKSTLLEKINLYK